MSAVEQSLLRVVDRIGIDRLAADPTLARVALKDVFPEDALVVSLLTAAVEHGALAALRERDDDLPLSVLGPRLANQLRRDTGISTASARWAVGAWAASLGMLPRALPDLPRDGIDLGAADVFGEAGPMRAARSSSAPEATREAPTLVGSAVTAPEAMTATATAAPSTEAARGPADVDDPADLTVRRTPDDTTTSRGVVDERPTSMSDPAGEADADAAPTMLRQTGAVGPAGSPPDAVTPSARRGRKGRLGRRGRLIALAGTLVLVLLAVGLTALILRPSQALAATGDPTHAAWTSGGRSTTISSGSTIPRGTDVEVRSGSVELTVGNSVVRLAAGAHARVNGPADLTVQSGRAFVLAEGTALTVRSTAGDARVSQGRLLVGCTTAACTVTALDAGTVLSKGPTSTSLRTLEAAGAGSPAPVVADAVRADPWFVENDADDRRQGRAPLGVTGSSVTGTWSVTLTRSDLPFAMKRTISISPDCGALGCAMRASTNVHDGVPQGQLTGSVRALAAGGSRVAVDYGSHTVRCHWVVGTKKGQGVDGAETVTDELDFSGTGSSGRVTGHRTSTYTPTNPGCTSSAYTATKVATLAGSRSTAAELTPAAQTMLSAQQQADLNYILDGGTGCSTVSTSPQTDLQSDQRCTYSSGAASSMELAVYGSSSGIRAAYTAETKGLVASGKGDCSTGPCEGVAPNGHGRLLLTTDSSGAMLITYDPRAANLLLTVRGPTMRGLASWWSDQQRSPSVYRAFPISRVGV